MSDSATAEGATPEAAETTTTETTTTETTEQVDLAAEVEKWRGLARKHEDRARTNAGAAKELERVKQESMTETEKAVAEAKAAGRSEALRETAVRLVDSQVRVAAAGRPVDVDAVLEGLDRSKFITDEGEPDTDAIAAWVDRIAPKPTEDENQAKPMFPDLGQGVRNGKDAPAQTADPLLRAVQKLAGTSR